MRFRICKNIRNFGFFVLKDVCFMSMKKRMLLADAITFLFFIAAVTVTIKTNRPQVMDGPDMINTDTFDFDRTYLTRVYYYKGGSSLGDDYSVRLTIEENDDGSPRTTIRYYELKEIGDDPIEKEVKSGSYVVSNVEEMIEVSGMKEWVNLPDNEVFALDAPSRRFVFEYSDGSEYILSEDKEVPDWNEVEKIVSYIVGCIGIEN